jgi:hypothetical protein
MRRDSGGTYVLVAAGAGFERRAIDVGFRGSEFSEILGGVNAGERVVIGSTTSCEVPVSEREAE